MGELIPFMPNIRIQNQEPDFAYQRRYVELHLQTHYTLPGARFFELKPSLQDQQIASLYRKLVALETYFIGFYFQNPGLHEKYLKRKGIVSGKSH
jgi:hypothetical protein